MRVFLAATSLRAAYGGPAVSVASLAASLAEAGMEVGLWARDGSVAETGLRDGGGLRLLNSGLEEALAAFGTPDLLHDNGLWLPHHHALASAAARRRLPRVVSTRGMLAPWARRHKRWKKTLAWRAYQLRDLERARLLHATSDAEAETLRGLDLGVAVEMIPNGVEIPPLLPPVERSAGRRTALFLGRIYPVKGLPMLLTAWAQVRPSGWRLVIAGPDEAGHRGELERLVEARSIGDAVSFSGPLAGEQKEQALSEADLLVLPSHTESFGIVVAEALAHGRPVLTTTAVPWPRLEAARCGWRTPPTTEGLAEGLRRALGSSPEALRNMGLRGRELVAADYGWPGIAARFVAAYERLADAEARANRRLTRAA